MLEEARKASTSLGKILDELGNGLPKLMQTMTEKPQYANTIAQEIKKKVAQGLTEKQNLNNAIDKARVKMLEKWHTKSMFQTVEQKRERTRTEFEQLKTKAHQLGTYIDLIAQESKAL